VYPLRAAHSQGLNPLAVFRGCKSITPRPDTDTDTDEVVLWCWRLFPPRRKEDGSAAEPVEVELNSIRNDTPA